MPARLPYGNIPRLLLAWVCTEAVRTQRRELVLGRSLYEFMRHLGMNDRSGGVNGQRTRLRNQMTRLFQCTVQLMRSDGDHEVTVSSLIADKSEYWWNTAEGPDRPGLFDSTIRLGEEFFNEVIKHPVPLDMNILRALKRSPLGLDLYMWLVYRTFTLTAPITLTWRQLFRQFGADPSKASNKKSVSRFRDSVLREMKKINRAWPDLEYRTVTGGLVIEPCPPRIPPSAQFRLIE